MQVEHLSNTRKWLLDYPVFHIDLKDTLTFVKDVSNNIVNNNPYTDIILVGQDYQEQCYVVVLRLIFILILILDGI